MSGFSLVPYSHPLLRDFFNFTSPSRIFDQNFGLGILEDDFLPPTLYHGFYARPRGEVSRQLSGTSEVKLDADKFQVMLDVNQFAPDEITVKTVDDWILVHGKHEEKKDDHGFISREFHRHYHLPEGVLPELVTSSLSQDGVLTLEAPRKAIEAKPNERMVPITRAPITAPSPIAVDQSASAAPADAQASL